MCGTCVTWSERRGSNPRHQPWKGCTLPTELRSHEMERTTGLEPVTSSLARRRTTNCTKSAFAPYPTAFSGGYRIPLYRPTERDSGEAASEWSDRWGTIPRHQPWEGYTLPTELLSHKLGFKKKETTDTSKDSFLLFFTPMTPIADSPLSNHIICTGVFPRLGRIALRLGIRYFGLIVCGSSQAYAAVPDIVADADFFSRIYQELVL